MLIWSGVGYSQAVKIRPLIASISPGGLKADYT